VALASLGGPDVRKRHRLQPCSDCQGWHVAARPRRTSAPHLRHRLRSLPVLTTRPASVTAVDAGESSSKLFAEREGERHLVACGETLLVPTGS